MKADEILAAATELVSGDRHKTHGDKYQNHMNIARLWNAYLADRMEPQHRLTPVDVAQLMGLLKIARTMLGDLNLDDYVDQAGYAGCAGEIAQTQAEIRAAGLTGT